jgi:hypothetical protein
LVGRCVINFKLVGVYDWILLGVLQLNTP